MPITSERRQRQENPWVLLVDLSSQVGKLGLGLVRESVFKKCGEQLKIPNIGLWEWWGFREGESQRKWWGSDGPWGHCPLKGILVSAIHPELA